MAINTSKTFNGSFLASSSLDSCAKANVPSAKNSKLTSDRFLEAISQFKRVVIVAHNNPDPDAIATGWAIKTLIEAHCPGKPVRFISGGKIARAENQHMVKRLCVPIEMLNRPAEQQQLMGDAATAIVLVDCGPTATHHMAASVDRSPTAVIDHHQLDETDSANGNQTASIPFVDVRPEIAAAASIAASYLQQHGVRPSWRLATALVYALKTETRGGENHFAALDREILHWLTEFADPALLAEIDDAPLSREYFLDLLVALQNTTIYGTSAYCIIPAASSPEIVGEVADLLVRCNEVHTVLCGTAVGSDVLISVRADVSAGDATELITETLQGIGTGGGHGCRAGGKIAGVCLGEGVPADIEDELLTRWLAANRAAACARRDWSLGRS